MRQCERATVRYLQPVVAQSHLQRLGRDSDSARCPISATIAGRPYESLSTLVAKEYFQNVGLIYFFNCCFTISMNLYQNLLSVIVLKKNCWFSKIKC